MVLFSKSGKGLVHRSKDKGAEKGQRELLNRRKDMKQRKENSATILQRYSESKTTEAMGTGTRSFLFIFLIFQFSIFNYYFFLGVFRMNVP